MDVTSDLRTSADINTAKETEIEENKKFYTVRKVVRHENGLKGSDYTICGYGYGSRTTPSSPPSTVPIITRSHTAEEYETRAQVYKKRRKKGSYLRGQQAKGTV